MNLVESIRSILIVGGGSSGWMTASLLARRLPDVAVSLVEASDIPTIGVGESTNPVIRYFHGMLGLDETAFMRASNAAFKHAIRFEGFNRLGGVFFHPFGEPPSLAATLFQPAAQAHHAELRLAEHDTRFSSQCAYAYQVDAGLYGQYLKGWCKRRGVRHIVDRVQGADLDEHGEILRIRTLSSGPLTADLYVDCSGFRSFLLGGTLHEPFRSVNNFLLNDRAIAARVPYVDRSRELKTWTNCTALSAGWVWEIPLWSRLGTGYVYSSAFLSPSAAEEEFRAFLGPERLAQVSFDHITIRAGRHDRAWVGNAVGVGISYGFLEPLESTGLSLTQVSIIDLAEALALGATPAVRDEFNARQARIFDTTRDFVMAHFVLTSREDTPYWRHIRHDNDMPGSLADVLEQAADGSYAPIDALADKFYGKLNWNLILSGMGMFGEADGARPAIDVPASVDHATLLADRVHAADDPDPAPEAEPALAQAHPIWAPTW